MSQTEPSLGSLYTHGKEKSSLHGLAKPGGREDGAGVILLPNERSLLYGNSQERKAELEHGDGGLPSLPGPRVSSCLMTSREDCTR